MKTTQHYRLSIVVSVLFALALLPLQAQRGTVAVLLPDESTSDRWANDDTRYLSEAFESAGVDYIILNAQGDAETQIAQAEEVIAQGVQVILFVNLDSTSGSRIIQMARSANIPIIDYDRLTIAGDGADFYVSFDNLAVGRLIGEGFVEAVQNAELTPPVRVVMLNGSETDNNASLYKQGYEGVTSFFFEEGEWIKLYDEPVPNWDNDIANAMFTEILNTYGDSVDAVIAANDGIANAVIVALEERNLPYLPLTGQDATITALQNILLGKQSMTVYKAIKAEAQAAAALAIALIKNEDPSGLVNGIVNNGRNEIPSVLLMPVIVTRENIAETVIADGFRTWEEICVDEVEAVCPELSSP